MDRLHDKLKERVGVARDFITEYSLWFDKYVDNGEYGKNYMDYSYARSKAKLLQFLNKL